MLEAKFKANSGIFDDDKVFKISNDNNEEFPHCASALAAGDSFVVNAYLLLSSTQCLCSNVSDVRASL